MKKHTFRIKFVIFLKLFLLFGFGAYANDSIRISGTLQNNTRFAKVVIQKFGVGIFDIAAVQVDKETGAFSITAPADVEPGIYRFRYSQTGFEEYVDVIINGKEKNIAFSIDVNLEPENRNPIFISSEENKEWYQYYKKHKDALNAIRVQQEFLFNYPNKKDKTYQTIFGEYEKAKQAYLKQSQSFIKKTPYYWCKAKAQYLQVNFTKITDHPRIQQFEAHEAFWNGKPTNDPLLLNTPLYTDAVLNYLQYYMNPEMEFGEEEQNKGFMKCVDKIMELFGGNETNKEFAIKYLQIGFKEIGNEKVLQYIDQTYAATAQCTTDDDELQKRLKGYETMKIGNAAPEVLLTTSDGTTKKLTDFPQKKAIIVFWASWCPHCMEEMPKLQEWAKTQENTLVVAVSLDDDYSAFQNTIKQFPDMLHYCDLQKWNGEIVSNFFVSATPTLLVLDENRKIESKWSSISTFISSK